MTGGELERGDWWGWRSKAGELASGTPFLDDPPFPVYFGVMLMELWLPQDVELGQLIVVPQQQHGHLASLVRDNFQDMAIENPGENRVRQRNLFEL